MSQNNVNAVNGKSRDDLMKSLLKNDTPIVSNDWKTSVSSSENTTPEMARRLDKHKQLCDYIYNLYRTKNNDYGNSVTDTYKKFGLDAFLVRMYDKLNRAYTLTRTKSMVESEKIDDTLLDLANYALLAVIELSEDRYKAQQ